MHVGIVVAVVVLQRLQHLAGLLAGGRIVQVDQRFPQAGGLGQQREIGPGEGRQVFGHRQVVGLRPWQADQLGLIAGCNWKSRDGWGSGRIDRGGGGAHG